MVCVEKLLALNDDLNDLNVVASGTGDHAADRPGSSSSSSSSSIVCKYFLKGQCLITNCQFLHSRTDRSVICRFHLRGFCARGDDCNFLHELGRVTTASTRSSPSVASPSQLVIAPASPGPTAPAVFDLVARMKLEQLQRLWSQVNPQVIEDCFRYARRRRLGHSRRLTALTRTGGADPGRTA